MNNLMLLVVLFVMFIYFGGSNVPLVLKQNKEMLLGVAGGLVLCSFFGMKLEGFEEYCSAQWYKDFMCRNDMSKPIWNQHCARTPQTAEMHTTLCGCDQSGDDFIAGAGEGELACPPINDHDETMDTFAEVSAHIKNTGGSVANDIRQIVKNAYIQARQHKPNPFRGIVSEWMRMSRREHRLHLPSDHPLQTDDREL
tara:strand:+ start:1431 stop:2021 length:591 start_codon:yes stop_codon:yes gene_type:complete